MIAQLAKLIVNAAAGIEERSKEHIVVYCRELHVRELVTRSLTQLEFDVENVEDADEAYWALVKRKQHAHVPIADRAALTPGRSPDIEKLRRDVHALRVVAVQISDQIPAELTDAVGAGAAIGRPMDRASLMRAATRQK
ncbi:MAG: hypothetical protein ABL904_00450 [Hyphomicrobiaceae bacterium]